MSSNNSIPHDKARSSLRREIEALVAFANDYDWHEAPFSPGELAVMAIICSRKDALYKYQILKWILKNLDYYREELIDEYLFQARGRLGSERARVLHPVKDFYIAFLDFEVPLREVWPLEVDEDGTQRIRYRARGNEGVSPTDSIGYTVTTMAARTFLAPHLLKKRKGKFPFLDLPPELRNVVYEYALRFPQSGIGLGRRRTLQPFLAERIDGSEPYEVDWLKADRSGKAKFELPKHALNILLTSKQVYQEAKPIFYHNNHFLFHGINTMQWAFTGVQKDRFRHVSSISILLNPSQNKNDIHAWLPAMRGASTIKQLKDLRILISDNHWLQLRGQDQETLGGLVSRAYKGIWEIPGFAELAVLAAEAETVVWLGASGDCVKIREFVEGEVAKIKAGEETIKAPPRGGFKNPRRRKQKRNQYW